MATKRQCPECGTTLRADVPAGACPVCALNGALGLSTTPAEVIVTEKPGDRIGRYKLLEQIGEGGYGVVYMAEQSEPICRRVALKIIKLGMDTKQVIARFEVERQTLALMDHPNIAKVLDAGTTEAPVAADRMPAATLSAGRPYFVMELVRGIRITDYCDEHNFSTRERLDLFLKVCHAIQHAHQKGIIHRDIKPSNILVTELDGVAVPKVIDFGIAKAASQTPLTDKTLFTAFQQFMGTPAYMSPEQAGLSGSDIDTRSDIYALGVLLYELVSGQTPFERKEFMQAGFDELRRMIRETEPPRPSTRLRALSPGDLTTLAKRRRTEPPRLVHLVRGDLDWIVMKCLEKDRARRYETANGLARDVQRHLNNEPVTAAAPTTIYRMSKFASRHRFGLVMAALVILLVAAGVVVSVREGVRATRAEREARENLARQEKASQEASEKSAQAITALNAARDEQQRAERALEDARQQKAQKEEALALAEAQRTNALDAKRVAEAAEARALRALQQATNAEAAALAARDESLRQQAKVEDFIGFMLFDLSGKLRPLGQADLLREVTTKVAAHYQSLTNNDESEQALSRRYAVSWNLAYALAVQGDTPSAERQYRASLEFAERLSAPGASGTNWQAELCACHTSLGEIRQARGDSVGALEQFQQSLEIARRQAAREPASAAWQERLFNNQEKLGDVLWLQGDKRGALFNYQSALKQARDAVARDSATTTNQHNLAVANRKLGAFLLSEGDEHAAMQSCSNSLRLARQLAETQPGNSTWQAGLAESLDSMGDAYLASKHPDEAAVHYRLALDIRQQLVSAFPANALRQQDMLHSLFKVNDMSANRGKQTTMSDVLLESLVAEKNFFNSQLNIVKHMLAVDTGDKGAIHNCSNLVSRVEQAATNYPANMEWQHDLARSYSLYGDVLLQQGAPEAALQQFEKALTIRKQLATNDPVAIYPQYWLACSEASQAAALHRLDRPDEAAAAALHALRIFAVLISRWPGNALFQEGSHLSQKSFRARIPIAPEQVDAAKDAFEAGYRKTEDQAANDSANPALQAGWADWCSARAVEYWLAGEPAKAIPEAGKALKVWRQLSQSDAANPDYRERLRRARISLAVLQLANRRFADVLATTRVGLQLEPGQIELNAIRALACFCGRKEEEGWNILRQNANRTVGLYQTFPQAVLGDLRRLRETGVTKLDVDKLESEWSRQSLSLER
jgi:serine/threonine protein kinase/tetratricopeptide (TPR) repeat protein